MKAAPIIQSDAFGHTEAELRLHYARQLAAVMRADCGECDEDAGEDDKRESDYERPTYVNSQTGALEFA